MKRIVVLLVLFTILTMTFGSENIKQDIEYLSSETCFGRNISNDGIYKAQDYIVDQLQKLNIPVTLQPVRYAVNQVLDTPVCVINGDTLTAGYDFVPHPFCPTVDGFFGAGQIEIYDHAGLEKIVEEKKLSSTSSARRYLLKKSKRSDRKKLLLFSGSEPLLSRQSKQYLRSAFQIARELDPDTVKSVYVSSKAHFTKATTHNIVAVIEGRTADSVICLSAHYDHMGGMGSFWYPGANDNASGVAVLLELARIYAQDPPPVTLMFCFFTGEEQGLKGSQAFVRHPTLPLKNIIMALNLDMVGSGLDGYGIVGGNDHPEDVSIFEDSREQQGIGMLHLRGNAPNSDHFPFTEKNVPALFFYSSGGEQPYHHPNDVPETLDWQALENTVLLMRDYIDKKSK